MKKLKKMKKLKIKNYKNKYKKHFKESYKNNKPFIVYEGSVRSGKTVVALNLFMQLVAKSSEKMHMIIGVTKGAVERNIIMNDFGIDSLFADYINYSANSKGGAKIEYKTKYGVKTILIRGGANVNDYVAFRGATLGYVFGDEANKFHKNTLNEINARTILSVNRKIIYTLNPEYPEHFFYTDYLNIWQQEKIVNYLHVTMNDNPMMTQKILDKAKMEVFGTEYDRKILGLRVANTGLCFTEFDTREHVIEEPNIVYHKYCISVDYGSSDGHDSVYLLHGIRYKIGSNQKIDFIYTIDELVIKGQSPSTNVDKFVDKLNEWYNIDKRIREAIIIVDNASRHLILEMQKVDALRRFIRGSYKWRVTERTEFLNGCFGRGSLLINPRCKMLIKQLQHYHWDNKLEPVPVKVNDDAVDAYVYGILNYKNKIGG